MPDAVSAVAGQTVALDPSLLAGATGGTTSASNGLDKDAFLKLLVAQLKYQDPMNPASNEEFISTTAQFTTIEKLDDLATQGAMASRVSSLATASALIGKQISVAGEDGAVLTATVQRGSFANGQLTLHTELGPIGLDQVLALTSAAATPTAPTTPTPAIAPAPTATETTLP